MNRFIDSGIVIAILTAFLFTLSVANYNGYLTAIGVEPSFILRSFHQILYNSLFVILPPLINIAIWGVTVCIFLYFIANIYTSLVCYSFGLKRKLVRFTLYHKKLKRSSVEVNSKKLIISIFPIALGALMIFGSLVASENTGKISGYELIEKIQKSDYLPHEVINIKGYKSQIYVVSCGINNCAGINVDTMKIEYFENKFGIGTTSNKLNITNN